MGQAERWRNSKHCADTASEADVAEPWKVKDAVLKQTCSVGFGTAPRFPAEAAPAQGAVQETPPPRRAAASQGAGPRRHSRRQSQRRVQQDLRRKAHAREAASQADTPGPGAYTLPAAAFPERCKSAAGAVRQGVSHSAAPAHAEHSKVVLPPHASPLERFEAVLASQGLAWHGAAQHTVTLSDSELPGREHAGAVHPMQRVEGATRHAVAAASAASRADDVIRSAGAEPPPASAHRTRLAAPEPHANAMRHDDYGVADGRKVPGDSARAQGLVFRSRLRAAGDARGPVASGGQSARVAAEARGGGAEAVPKGRKADLNFAKAGPRWADGRPVPAWRPSWTYKKPPQPSPAASPPRTGKVVYATGERQSGAAWEEQDGKVQDDPSPDEGVGLDTSRGGLRRALQHAVRAFVKGLGLGGDPEHRPPPWLNSVLDEADLEPAHVHMPAEPLEHACEVCRVGTNPCAHSSTTERLLDPHGTEARLALSQEVVLLTPVEYWAGVQGDWEAVPAAQATAWGDLRVVAAASAPQWVHLLQAMTADIRACVRRHADATEGVGACDTAKVVPAYPYIAPKEPRTGVESAAPDDSRHPTQAPGSPPRPRVHLGSTPSDAFAQAMATASRIGDIGRTQAATKAARVKQGRVLARQRATKASVAMRADTPDGGSASTSLQTSYNLGKHAVGRPAAAFGSSAPRLQGRVPGGVTVQTGPWEEVVVVRRRSRPFPKPQRAEPVLGSEDEDSDASGGGKSDEEEGGVGHPPHSPSSSPPRSTTGKGEVEPAHAGPLPSHAGPWSERRVGGYTVQERLLAQHDHPDGGVVQVLLSRRPARRGGGPMSVGGASPTRPRQGKGVVRWGVSRGGQTPPSPPSTAWADVVDVATTGVRQPPSAAPSTATAQRLVWVDEASFLDAAEAVGAALLRGRRPPSTPAWEAIQTAQAWQEAQRRQAPLHPAAAVHGKDTPALQRGGRGGVVMAPPSKEAAAAAARRQAAQAAAEGQRQANPATLHAGAGGLPHRGISGDVSPATKHAFGRTLPPGAPGPGPLPPPTAAEESGDASPPHGPDMVLLDMAVHEQFGGGRRAPAWRFGGPLGPTPPPRLVDAEQGGEAVLPLGALQEALALAQALVQAPGPAAPLPSPALDRPDRMRPRAAEFGPGPSRGLVDGGVPQTLADAVVHGEAAVDARLVLEHFTGVPVAGAAGLGTADAFGPAAQDASLRSFAQDLLRGGVDATSRGQGPVDSSAGYAVRRRPQCGVDVARATGRSGHAGPPCTLPEHTAAMAPGAAEGVDAGVCMQREEHDVVGQAPGAPSGHPARSVRGGYMARAATGRGHRPGSPPLWAFAGE